MTWRLWVLRIRVRATEMDDYSAARARAESKLASSSASMVETLAAFAALTELAPEQPDAWIGLAHASIKFGEWDRAKASVERSLEAAQEQPDLVSEIAASEILARLGSVERASELLQLTSERVRGASAPVVATWTHACAIVALRAGDAEGAEELLLRALELDPGFRVARNDLNALRATVGAQGE